MSKTKRRLTMSISRPWIAGLLFGATVWSAWAEPVAMVTDLKGKAELVSGAKKSAVAILTEIEPEARIQVQGDGQLVLMYLQSGEEYMFSGNSQFMVGPKAPQAISGPPPQKRTAVFGKVASAQKIKPGGLAQAAVVMRSVSSEQQIRILSLADTVTLDLNPEFRWEGVRQGATYAFSVQDEYGEAVWSTEIQDTSAFLPQSVKLKEGRQYLWKVKSLDKDKPLESQGAFRIAPLDIRIQVESLRPNPSAPLSDQVAFAVWLRQAEFRDEARKYWKILSSERKDDEALKALARE